MCNLSTEALALLAMEEEMSELNADIKALSGVDSGVGSLDMSWDEDEEKMFNKLPLHDIIKDPQIWEEGNPTIGYVTRPEYVRILSAMLMRDMENAEKYIETIKNSVLVTSVAQIFSSEAETKYSPNSIKAAYNVFQELAQYRIPLSETEPNHKLIIKVLQALEEVMYRSEYKIDHVLNVLYRIVIARKNDEITKHVKEFYQSFILNSKIYGRDEDGLEEYRIKVKILEAKIQKNITPMIEIGSYFSADPERAQLNESIITWVSEIILEEKELAPFSDQVIATIASATDCFPDEKKPDVIETVCYLSTQLASEQTISLIVSVLNMLAMQNADKKEMENAVIGIKDTLKNMARKFPDQDVRIFSMLMNIEGKSPEDQMKAVCDSLAIAPSDKEKGYNAIEEKKQKELLHSADHLMQQSEKTVQIYVDKISGLTADNAPFIKLVAEDILQMFFKILGAVETYSNFNKAPDDVKKKVKEQVMPDFMNTFNVQITQGFVNVIAEKLADNNIDKLPMHTVVLILDILKKNITAKDSKTYLPYLKVLLRQLDTDAIEVRQKSYAAALEIVRFMWKNCKTEMLCQFIELLNDRTKYPSDLLQLLVDSIMSEEIDECMKEVGMYNVDYLCHRLFCMIQSLVYECDNKIFLHEAQEQAGRIRDFAMHKLVDTYIAADAFFRENMDEYISNKVASSEEDPDAVNISIDSEG